jgi:hypothetical protein
VTILRRKNPEIPVLKIERKIKEDQNRRKRGSKLRRGKHVGEEK